MENEILKHIHEGKDIMFTFKSTAERFAQHYKLEIEYNDGEFIDDEHYIVKKYNAKIYWIAP